MTFIDRYAWNNNFRDIDFGRRVNTMITKGHLDKTYGVWGVDGRTECLCHCDEGSGTRLYDYSPNGFNSTGGNWAWSTSSRFGRHTTDLDGVDDYIDFPARALMSEGTIDAWVYPRSFANGPVLTIERDDVGGLPRVGDFQFSFNAAGNLGILVWGGAGWTTNFTAATTMPLNRWTHFAITWGAFGKRLYYNNIQDANSSADAQGLYNPLSPEWRWGKISSPFGNLFPFNAKIDEIRLSSVARPGFN